MNSDKKPATKQPPVPSVDPNAPLEIEKITKSSNVPTVDKNAPLKIEEVEEKEENEPQEKSNNKLFILGGIILGIIVITAAALFIFSSTQPQTEETKEEKVTPTPTEAPKQVLKREAWSFEVLNGSGVSGVAKKLADKLIALGYQVVEIGNADKQTYEGNQLIVSQKMEDKVNLVVVDLKNTIKIATIAATLKDSTASARIIIGKE